MTPIFKYPRTPHITGSRIQPGDEDLKAVGREVLAGRALVIEEKLDGSNSGVSFDADGTLILQSRGQVLRGAEGPAGAIEKHIGQSHCSSTELMEGLYLKREEEGRVVGRYKYVRPDFLQAVVDSDSHWLDRPIEPNRLRDGVDLFA